MLYRGDLALTSHSDYKSLLRGLRKTACTVGSLLWEGSLWFVFAIISICLLDLEGASAETHALIGFLYLLTVGRRALFAQNNIFSLALLPCAFPAYVFLFSCLPDFHGSNAQEVIELGVWIAFARWPLFFQPEKNQVGFRSIAKKLIFFAALQGFYGVMLQSYNPKFLENLEWEATGVGLKPDHLYPSKTGVQFFYEDLSEAEEIEACLPEALSILQGSPFYRNSKELVFVQKNRPSKDRFSRNQIAYMRGCCHPFKQYSYYFSDPNKSLPRDPVYYSHNNTYRSVAIHEMTHQLLSRYYGKWNAFITLALWKNEGYAEYMANTEFYLTKDDLLELIMNYPISDEVLSAPFTQEQPDQEDYMAAFLQTRYALDGKKQSPIEFMKRSYKPVSAQDLKEWLSQEDSHG